MGVCCFRVSRLHSDGERVSIRTTPKHLLCIVCRPSTRVEPVNQKERPCRVVAVVVSRRFREKTTRRKTYFPSVGIDVNALTSLRKDPPRWSRQKVIAGVNNGLKENQVEEEKKYSEGARNWMKQIRLLVDDGF